MIAAIYTIYTTLKEFQQKLNINIDKVGLIAGLLCSTALRSLILSATALMDFERIYTINNQADMSTQKAVISH